MEQFFKVRLTHYFADPVDNMVREEARSVVLNLRLLAKFLGFLEFLPYQTKEHLPENVLANQIALRSKVRLDAGNISLIHLGESGSSAVVIPLGGVSGGNECQRL